MNGSSVEANDEDDWAGNRVGLMSALSRMQEALRLLDESDAPPQVGAQLDLAIQQLKQEIEGSETE
jgi:hypothetical protein